MACSNQNNYQSKTINTQIVSALGSQQVEELEDSINITYGILENIFQIWENVPVMQIIPCLAILSKKVNVILPTLSKKPNNFMRKTKNYLKKNKMTLKNYIQISQKGKKKSLLGMWLFFCQNLGIVTIGHS